MFSHPSVYEVIKNSSFQFLFNGNTFSLQNLMCKSNIYIYISQNGVDAESPMPFYFHFLSSPDDSYETFIKFLRVCV